MIRVCSLLLVVLVWSAPSLAQTGTVMPIPLAQWLNNDGTPLSAGGLCVYNAGTSTLKSTYTTAALTVANANPILLDSAGRPTSGGVFLVPGQSYKFTLKDFSAVVGPPTCVPDSGVSRWVVDNVQAVPGSSGAVDVTVPAGESISAGDAVYICTGTPCANAGQMYRTDADLTTASTNAAMVGIAPNAIAAGASGSMRVVGEVTFSGGVLTPGQPYFLSTTTGAIGLTPPTNSYRIGQAVSATVLSVGQQLAPAGPHAPPCGRLTLTSNTPITTADVTAATTLYYTPYGGCNELSAFTGTSWNRYAFTQLSIAVPGASSQVYDVFVYDNAGALALELTAWSSGTTRATALATQNGVYVRSGALTRLYLGTFRTTAVAGQAEDSLAKRFVWNYYNRTARPMQVLANGTWNYTTATWRQANASAANQVEFIVGVTESPVSGRLVIAAQNAGANAWVHVGFGLDSVTAPNANTQGGFVNSGSSAAYFLLYAMVELFPAVGYHYLAWLEWSTAAGTTQFVGAGGAAAQSGLSATVWG